MKLLTKNLMNLKDLKFLIQVANKINVPLSEWPGNCFGIALACVKEGVVNGKPRYGHWLGPIHSKSMFKKNKAIGFAQHGWVELTNGKIFDPTRYVFEHVKPYIYVGENDFYDMGGNAFRKATMGPPPTYVHAHKQCSLKVSPPCHVLLKYLLEDGRMDTFSDVYSLNQLFYLGNLPPNEFGPFVKEVYTAFQKSGSGGIIPFDNWNYVME